MDITGLISATLSSPHNAATTEKILGRPYVKVKIRLNTASMQDSSRKYCVEKFTATQAFHDHISCEQLITMLDECVGAVFRDCVVRTMDSETSYYTTGNECNFKVHQTTRSIQSNAVTALSADIHGDDRIKSRILREGVPVPFLVRLGVMTDKGKVVASKRDKFVQINRFLEYVRDILPVIMHSSNMGDGGTGGDGGNQSRPLRVIDFGSGKAYLTFAIHYYLTEVCRMDARITGIDLKSDVVDYCNTVAAQLHCAGLHFETGDIARYIYEDDGAPDLVVALHACDTATDEALSFAVKAHSRAILSAPCCQHEVNKQLEGQKNALDASPFAPLLRYGLLRERFAALATDALRAEYLEAAGYNVQLLEFTDAQHTPKNLLIRATLRGNPRATDKAAKRALQQASTLVNALGITPKLATLLPPPPVAP